MRIDRLGLFLGPLAAAAMLLAGPPGELEPSAWRVAACMAWMAVWWMTEAVPVAVTALLPIVLFPLLGIGGVAETTARYAHPTIFLFLGGFLLALAIERCHLHRRVALSILLASGASSRSLMAGFMVAAALLSMWISNTATTIMLLPMGLAVIAVIGDTVRDVDPSERANFQTALLLSIAYAATIGGVATLIGTPPNAFMAAFMAENYGLEIGFLQWMGVGLPITLVMLPIAWLALSRVIFPFRFKTSAETAASLARLQSELGPLTEAEKRVALVFVATALGWASRPLLDNWPALAGLSDAGIACMAGISLFLLPAGGAGDGADRRLLEWADTRDLPWGILLLFGGGLALAAAVGASGLAAAMGAALTAMEGVNQVLLLAALVALVIFLTELTSNLATTATFLPVAAVIAAQAGLDPIVLIAPVALAASCAFMLPVATPPNAIVYGGGKVTIAQMCKAGLALNVVAIVLVSAVGFALVPLILLSL